MLKERKIARSYAHALFDLSEEMGLIPLIFGDMLLIDKVLKENPDLKKLLSSPVIKGKKKSDILEAILSAHVHELTIRFLHLLCKSLRVIYLSEVCEQYMILYRDHMGIRTVKISSAVALEEGTRTRLLTILREKLNAEIELEEIDDPRLVGGFVLQAGDQRFDASIKSKLNKLHREFDINVFNKGF